MAESGAFEGRPLVGDVIAGKYRIESVAGEGGMGIVYEAEHVILRQRVAVKVLLPGAMTSTEAIERFSVEAAAVARLKTEHVARVMDAGALPTGEPYLVMELLEGADLERLLQVKGPLRAADVVDWVLQALEALAHAHAAQVIHRDLKPANLFRANVADGRQIIKLLDFGVAKAVDLGAEEDPDHILGSPSYMSPEQLSNAPLDARSDLWSIGVVMYELLSGDLPFPGLPLDAARAILHQHAPPLGEKLPSIPKELSAAIMKCLTRDRDQRWATAAELARAIAPFGSGAWNGAVQRIERALNKAVPVNTPRRFATYENALQALELDPHGGMTKVPPPVITVAERREPASGVRSPDAFLATLPAPSSAPVTQTEEKKALRILLIDDSALVLDVHKFALTSVGFDVRTTSSATELEALIASWEPHLVLMDVEMPGTTGEELCRRVKSKYRATVPVVFVSSLGRDKLAEVASKGGADAFFSKTADTASFVGFVKNVCALTYSPEDLPDGDF